MSDATAHAKRTVGAADTPQFEPLSTGVMARIIPVGASLIDDVVASIPDPPVPKFFNEDKQREEENPLDPAYQEALTTTQRRRAIAAMETLLLFGLELQEVPADDIWLSRVRYLEKRGHLSLAGYDPADPVDRELLYKKYVAVGTVDLIHIGQKAGLNSRDVEEAARVFKS